ncbi:hybrid sensor histidine kinase/response regulator [Geobacter sp. SVR]|uniref:ATP-binding response regulator n=1 Tax=Geobacter sp. SVR TaxID=2495594 RepID=UPI00143EF8EA|nr:hybrid sensor histidine kinase/response regulator [Geobacter sp. SVR]BCS53728.1 hypothetical protein GSVR_20360 [Geobacter sp. SVR]GCF85763.1 hypothetical protein GSbR_23630 [Geobacter sp. SVR]
MTDGIRSLNGEPARILVVDDEEGILCILAHHLGKYGAPVRTASCPAEAYDVISESEFDVILTDVTMPGEDGITFLGKVHERLPDVPVIIMTGYAKLQYAVDAIKNGAFDFIHKPFDFAHLDSVIAKAIKFSYLRRLERNYNAELEKTVIRRTNELKETLAELDAAREALFTATQQKNRFMSTITHEMRTPMNGVIGALELLMDEELTGSRREYAVLARQASDNMLDLIDRLLSFADGTTRSPVVPNAWMDIAGTIGAVAREHRPQFAAKGLAFDVLIDSALPERIMCDREKLSRLLDILLGNSLKFTEQGFVRLDVSEQNKDGRGAVRFCVSDSGIGIPEDMLERIFDPFTQVDSSLTRRYGGAGLGLSIARQISLLLNGDLSATSVEGQGSSFHFLMHV